MWFCSRDLSVRVVGIVLSETYKIVLAWGPS